MEISSNNRSFNGIITEDLIIKTVRCFYDCNDDHLDKNSKISIWIIDLRNIYSICIIDELKFKESF